MAEAQRRVASEAERLDREGGGAADARRRLAGEKEQLADRVDALQQAAQRLGAIEGEPRARRRGGSRLAQQLGQKMRAGAQGLRDGKAGKAAPAEQQIADALDKVARKINGADAGGAKGDTQQLADQLDEVRDARERLARLEKQIADAKQAAEGRAAAATAPQPGRAGTGRPGGAARGSAARSGDGQGGGDLQRLQQEYNRELQRTRELMDRVAARHARVGRAAWRRPKQHEWSRSAPGTEAFKQDYAAWQSLAGDVAKALERAEAAVAGRLSSALAKDRLRAGGSERVPDAYRQRVSKYFESIATQARSREVTFAQSASAVGPRGRRCRRARRRLAGVPPRADRARPPARRCRRCGFATLLWLVVCLMRPMIRATDVSPRDAVVPILVDSVAQHGAGRRRRRAPHRSRARARRAATCCRRCRRAFTPRCCASAIA